MLLGGGPGCREEGAEQGDGEIPSCLSLSLVCSDRCAYKELTLGKLPNSSETQFPHLKSEDKRDSFPVGPQTRWPDRLVPNHG